jgi:hypothetical protein
MLLPLSRTVLFVIGDPVNEVTTKDTEPATAVHRFKHEERQFRTKSYSGSSFLFANKVSTKDNTIVSFSRETALKLLHFTEYY